MTFKHILLAATLVALPATAAFAQTTYGERHHINERKQDQQERIAQGVRTGQLTPRETGRLENQEARIQRQEHRMRSRDDGHLNAYDRHKLAREQNVESRRIYNQKHDGQRY